MILTQRGLTIALIASAALNLFVIGAVVGGVVVGANLWEAGPGGGAGGGRPGQAIWRAADSLSPEQRQAYLSALRGRSMHIGGELREARKARQEAWSTLAAQPADPAAVNRKLAEARKLEMSARADIEATVVTFAATLSPAERARLMQGLAHSGGPRGGDGERGGMGRRGGPDLGRGDPGQGGPGLPDRQ